ncbi:hypothetical protein AOB46_03285 [Chryseobacterium indologenes]|uniref:Uncharacterized protein n=2 Tax=Chryseobacterium indologenes TaxID=253 RepID=A0A0N0IYD8_CHRID|nr:hypothetical protein AOB46_03285 [Chryseobacterium indologenes]
MTFITSFIQLPASSYLTFKFNNMIKINGHWYSSTEVKEALEKKGYTIITLEISTERRDYPQYETYALMNREDPTVLNTLKSVALKEFQKRPPLL